MCDCYVEEMASVIEQGCVSGALSEESLHCNAIYYQALHCIKVSVSQKYSKNTFLMYFYFHMSLSLFILDCTGKDENCFSKTLMYRFYFFHIPWCPPALWNVCLFAGVWGHSLSCLHAHVLHFSGLCYSSLSLPRVLDVLTSR